MISPELERALRERGAVVVSRRTLRKIIRRDVRAPGLGFAAPHSDSYLVPRSALDRVDGVPEGLPARVVLLAREPLDEASDAPLAAWRALFHERVHQVVDAQFAGRPAALKARIHRIGQTEFDEVRFVLRHDDRLVAPHDDAATYAELAALWAELRAFAPELLGRTFPALGDVATVDAALSIDSATLLAETRLPGTPTVDELRARVEQIDPRDKDAVGEVRRWRGAAPRETSPDGAPRSSHAVRVLGRIGPMLAKARGAGPVAGEMRAFVERLAAALRWRGAIDDDWTETLAPIVAAAARAKTPFDVDARTLYDIERACIASEEELFTVDVLGWVRHFGSRPVRRALPLLRDVHVVKSLRAALEKVPRSSAPEVARGRFANLLRDCVERAEINLRAALRPPMQAAFSEIGLDVASTADLVAEKKLIEELIDIAVERGQLSLGLLRDAFSRNALKLDNLHGLRELVTGDALLRADDRLSIALDGVYRRGEIYLRLLARSSELLFATRIGRFLTLFVLLPLGGAYVGLEGVQHVVGPLAEILFHEHIHHIFQPTSFIVTTALLFALIHSAGVRAGAMLAARSVGFVLHTVFVATPRWVARLPVVRAIVRSRPLAFVWRYVGKPLVPVVAAWLLFPRARPSPGLGALEAAGVVGVLDVALNSRVGLVAQAALGEWVSAQASDLTHRVLPGIVALLAHFFGTLLEGFERGIYAVDTWLRYRGGAGAWSIALKAVAGSVWGVVAYVLRIYVNVLIEPQLNPLKHFPVVTVAAKIILPFAPRLVHAGVHALEKVMPRDLARAIGAPPILLLPGFFGFLVWEFKENYKLYRQNQRPTLAPVLIGHHGESMAALLKPGLHSGTIPKTYAKLRRASFREGRSALVHREALHDIEEAIRRFVERELVELLAESALFGARAEVGRIEMASNRVRIELACPAVGADSATLAFEEQSGWLLAGVAQAGWIDLLDDTKRIVLENALAGLYARAAVDLVRERVEAHIGEPAPYDIADDGLVIWPGGDYEREIVEPLVANCPIVTRAAWEAAWKSGGEVKRIVEGASLLPPRRAPADVTDTSCASEPRSPAS
jgi:hypothetical protein